MQNSLFDYLQNSPELEPVAAMRAVVAWLRPQPRRKASPVVGRMIELQQWLEENPEAHQRLAAVLQQWLLEASYFEVFTSLGILSRRGFSREFRDRLYERLNPAPRDPFDIRDALALVFTRGSDADWVTGIPTDSWTTFLSMLWSFDAEQMKKIRYKVCSEALYAMEMLSIWFAAEELEPEILRLDPKVVTRDSAFVAQQRELSLFIRDYQQWLDDKVERYDDEHLRVLFSQCHDALTSLRKRTVKKGSSVALTHLLERLHQTLGRVELLLDSLTVREREAFNAKAVELFKQLVRASTERNSLRVLWRQNSRLLARSVTENASHHGEHYITGDRSEYLQMLRSGAGGGLIIAGMALIKVQIIAAGFPAFTETVLSSLNYALGFMLIHVVGFTVATKQPAMTAARFANVVEQGDKGRANAARLADLLVRVSRSQFIAIVGNVGIAMSLAFGLSWAWGQWQGVPLVTSETGAYLLHRLDPIGSLALLHAAIAGVWLFLAGLISGYFDNRAARLELADRLNGHPLLTLLLPANARERLAAYLDANYGALIGNFAFGLLLGSTGYVGYLMGLPLDIRHVAFASADLGYGGMATAVETGQLLLYAGSVLLIGGINLWVSFSLALAVALRARGTRMSRGPELTGALWRQIRQQPSALLFPPAPQESGSDDGGG
ncbi:MAG: site-specific recombinase [Haliea sp.]